MNPVPLFLIIVTLPLLVGGCREKESVVDVKTEKPASVNAEELEQRESIWYLKESKTPYTGKAYSLHANRKKAGEWNYKNGKQDGLFVWWNEKGKKVEEENYINGKQDGLDVHWHNNGQKSYEANYKDGKLVEGSEKFWNNKGDSVDIKKEAEAE